MFKFEETSTGSDILTLDNKENSSNKSWQRKKRWSSQLNMTRRVL